MLVGDARHLAIDGISLQDENEWILCLRIVNVLVMKCCCGANTVLTLSDASVWYPESSRGRGVFSVLFCGCLHEVNEYEAFRCSYLT